MPIFEAEVTYKVRHHVTLEADNPDQATMLIDKLVNKHVSWTNIELDTFISKYSSKVKVISA
jgi:hypothetical protein